MSSKNKNNLGENEKGVDLETYNENKEITDDNYNKDLCVECNNGKFVGLQDGDVITYKGIPYAQQPVGKLRFKPPVEASDSDKVFEAYYLGKASIQTECETEMSSYYEQGEDCLTLNVYKNSTSQLEKKPVMVFIHGGAFGWGGTADPLYEGTNLIQSHKDVILVTTNYRVCILGFINLSILGGGDEYKESGNLGILDLICALKWVQKNIEKFGGDPNNVTIFGESAGGCAVSILPLIEGTKGLFHHVIAQSGSYQFTNSIESSLVVTQKIIELTNFKTVEELLKLSENEIRELISQFEDDVMIFPVRDGITLPKDLYNEFDTFDFSGIDFFFGTNKDEYRYWIEDYGGLDIYKEAVPQLYENYLSQFSESDKKYVKIFLDYVKGEEIWKLTSFLNDYMFRIPAIAQAEKICKRGGKVFMYYWTFPSAIENLGACHAVELSSVFNNLRNHIYTGGNVNEELAKTVQEMWINFATKGDPSTEKYKCNCYDLSERRAIVLGDDIHEEKDILSTQRILLAQLPKYYLC